MVKCLGGGSPLEIRSGKSRVATQGEGAQRAKGEVPVVRPSLHSCVLAQPRVPLTMGMGEGARVTQSEPCLGRLPSVSQLVGGHYCAEGFLNLWIEKECLTTLLVQL